MNAAGDRAYPPKSTLTLAAAQGLQARHQARGATVAYERRRALTAVLSAFVQLASPDQICHGPRFGLKKGRIASIADTTAYNPRQPNDDCSSVCLFGVHTQAAPAAATSVMVSSEIRARRRLAAATLQHDDVVAPLGKALSGIRVVRRSLFWYAFWYFWYEICVVRDGRHPCDKRPRARLLTRYVTFERRAGHDRDHFMSVEEYEPDVIVAATTSSLR